MVIELDGNPVEVFTIDCFGQEVKRPDNFLTVLPRNSPEALLLERPEVLASWVDEAPLKLVALALSSIGGEGRMADIRAKLDGRVLEAGKWDNWWKKQQQQMRKLPACFKVAKRGKDTEYDLLVWYDSVPAASEVKKSETTGAANKGGPTTADWKRWLQAHTHETPPGRFPTRPVANALAKWPAKTIEPALLRLIVSAEEALASDGASAQVAEGWLRAVAQASLRWQETAGTDTAGYTAARVGGVLARLTRIAGNRTPQDLLLQAGAMDGNADAWRRGFLAGMWEAFDGEDAREMYHQMAAALGRQARGDLAREMFLAAFGPHFSERRHTELDRLLDALPEGERAQLLKEVIASATTAQRGEVREYIAATRHAEGAGQMPLRVAAAMMLTDGQGKFAVRTSRELVSAFASPGSYGPAIQSSLQGIAARVAEMVEAKDLEVAELREAHEARLEQELREQDRLRQQVRERNAELAANREESRLRIRRDMLLAVGEVLQLTYREEDSKSLAGSVKAGLSLALGAGDAELLETPGTLVEYNPQFHEIEEDTHSSGMVQVVAPGVIFRGGLHGDRVLLKAHVRHEAS